MPPQRLVAADHLVDPRRLPPDITRAKGHLIRGGTEDLNDTASSK